MNNISQLKNAEIYRLEQKLGSIIEHARKRGSLTLKEGEQILNIGRKIGLEENSMNKYYKGLEEEYGKGFDSGYNKGYADGYKTGLEKGMDVTNIPIHQSKNQNCAELV